MSLGQLKNLFSNMPKWWHDFVIIHGHNGDIGEIQISKIYSIERGKKNEKEVYSYDGVGTCYG